MDAPPPPPSYPPPQRFPNQLIIKEAQNYAGESNRTWDSPQNQPLSSKSPNNTLPRTLSVGSTPSELFNFTAESKFNSNRANGADSKISKRDNDKSNYIIKEQQIRAQQLEKEKYLWSSAYMARRVVSTATARAQLTGDFHNADWTPQDSAYGAAFPFCGWIPKGLREAVERIIVVLALIAVVYTIVTVGMQLTNGITRSRHSSDTNLYTNDDFYVEDSSYTQNDNDDIDDLFYDNDTYNDYYNRIR